MELPKESAAFNQTFCWLQLSEEHFFGNYTVTPQRNKQGWPENLKGHFPKSSTRIFFLILGAKSQLTSCEICAFSHRLLSYQQESLGFLWFCMTFFSKSLICIQIWSSCVLSHSLLLKRWIFSIVKEKCNSEGFHGPLLMITAFQLILSAGAGSGWSLGPQRVPWQSHLTFTIGCNSSLPGFVSKFPDLSCLVVSSFLPF